MVGEHLAAAVRDARLTRGLSQAELARRAGITPSYLSRIEAAAWNEGGPWPSDGVLRSLARVLGLSSTALIDARTKARRGESGDARRAPSRAWGRHSERATYAVSMGNGAVGDAADRLVHQNPCGGSLRITESALLGGATTPDHEDEPRHTDALESRLVDDPETVLYRVCASTPGNLPLVRHTTERLMGDGDQAAVAGNVRIRFFFGNPVVLDIVIGETEVLIALPDRRGHPHHRAGVVIDDPDFVTAAREWFDESVWESPVEHVEIGSDRLAETLDAIEARLTSGGPAI